MCPVKDAGHTSEQGGLRGAPRRQQPGGLQAPAAPMLLVLSQHTGGANGQGRFEAV